MKYLKLIGFSILGVILILVVIGFLQPSVVTVQSERIIKAKPCEVYEYVIDLEKRLQWSPVENLDSAIITKLGSQTRGVGASYSWANETSGASGRLTIADTEEPNFVIFEMIYGEDGKAHEELRLNKAKDGTKVVWVYRHEMGNNPFARIMGVFIREGMRPIYKKGTAGLKEIVESDPHSEQYCTSPLPAEPQTDED